MLDLETGEIVVSRFCFYSFGNLEKYVCLINCFFEQKVLLQRLSSLACLFVFSFIL